MAAVKKMHADEVDTDEELVRRLLLAQFPEWAALPIEAVASAGTDNALYRIGDELVARLPRINWAIGQVDKEHRWLPVLAPHLPLAIPVPLVKGEPEEGYPWHWSVCRWLDGENATTQQITDPVATARKLANFVVALQRVDPTGGPTPGGHNSSRGVPLATRDAATRAAIVEMAEMFDSEAMLDTWEASLDAPTWDKPPVWIHGDLQSGNLLVQDGRLSAVIDFGCLGVGDPACDVMAGWTLFQHESRDAFRTAIQVDDATWERGRGWALSTSAIALPYYKDTNPVLAGIAQNTITEVLADSRDGD